MEIIKRHCLISFFLITYGISWGIPGLALLLSSVADGFEVSMQEYSLLSYIAILAPAISAFIVILVSQGKTGLLAYLKRLLDWEANWTWYAIVLLAVPLINLIAAILMKVSYGSWLVKPTVPISTFLLTVLLKGTEGPFEELGWRGFALPLLQRRFSGLKSAIILGFIWMLWHVPALFFQTVMTQAFQGDIVVMLLRLFVGGIATTIIMTVIYNGSGGSITLMFLWHWLSNIPYPWESGSGISIMQDVLMVLIAIIFILTLRDRYLGKNNLFTNVIPGIPEPDDV
jgi:hypothetical protein